MHEHLRYKEILEHRGILLLFYFRFCSLSFFFFVFVFKSFSFNLNDNIRHNVSPELCKKITYKFTNFHIVFIFVLYISLNFVSF